MITKDGTWLEVRRLCEQELDAVRALMEDVASRLPERTLFVMDDRDYLRAHVEDKGEIHGVFAGGNLVGYTVLAYKSDSEDNLGREFGVPDEQLPLVAVLDSSIVHESARGLGLQRYFHQLREEQARRKGCLYVYATVHPDNLPSIRNLEAAGLVRQFTRLMYGGKLRHCYAKQLDPGNGSTE